MQVLDGKDRLRYEKFSSGLSKTLLFTQYFWQIAERTVIQGQVQISRSLKAIVQTYYERVIHSFENIGFTYCVL